MMTTLGRTCGRAYSGLASESEKRYPSREFVSATASKKLPCSFSVTAVSVEGSSAGAGGVVYLRLLGKKVDGVVGGSSVGRVYLNSLKVTGLSVAPLSLGESVTWV